MKYASNYVFDFMPRMAFNKQKKIFFFKLKQDNINKKSEKNL